MNYSAFPPAEIRALIRAGKLDAPTTGCCDGYAQGNLVVLPKALAWDFLLFCQRNPKACPLLEVADAMGMDKKRKFRQVEVPLAMPGIISGIRMAMSEVIASATLAAYIGAGGLGILIFNGINLLKTEYLVIGGGTVAVITMLCSMALGAVEKKISRAL